MDHALILVGLPVTCAFGDCGVKGHVKPGGDHGGWYKSKVFRIKHKRWYCPAHYEQGAAIDDKFFTKYIAPEPEPPSEEVTIIQLYAELD